MQLMKIMKTSEYSVVNVNIDYDVSFDLLAPANNGIIPYEDYRFRWSYISDVLEYNIKVTNEYGSTLINAVTNNDYYDIDKDQLEPGKYTVTIKQQ